MLYYLNLKDKMDSEAASSSSSPSFEVCEPSIEVNSASQKRSVRLNQEEEKRAVTVWQLDDFSLVQQNTAFNPFHKSGSNVLFLHNTVAPTSWPALQKAMDVLQDATYHSLQMYLEWIPLAGSPYRFLSTLQLVTNGMERNLQVSFSSETGSPCSTSAALTCSEGTRHSTEPSRTTNPSAIAAASVLHSFSSAECRPTSRTSRKVIPSLPSVASGSCSTHSRPLPLFVATLGELEEDHEPSSIPRGGSRHELEGKEAQSWPTKFPRIL